MLKQRIITALILAPLVLWGILRLSTEGFALMAALVFALGGWEWARLAGLQKPASRAVGFILPFLLLLWLAYDNLLGREQAALCLGIGALVWWLICFVFVVRYPASSGLWRASAPARALAGLLILAPAWAALVLMHRDFGPGYVVLSMLLVWSADTGAFIAGRRFGRRKLAPRVSPGKSWEGVIGGLLAALLVTVLAPAFGLTAVGGLLPFVLMCGLVVLVSVLGDLVESMFKRIVDIKDSGGLLPGHGGVMDRIDSLTAAAPMLLLGLALLEGHG